ncbi:acetyl-CoA synthetase-like protein [Fistulina hepatica ATCC 64428]|uniref:Acetyl-CoA synthetase-like protein n=1 Tax=Fistulina hepatica ATCC 64428 TaxID=1128425 RepID=A0A0D7ANV8_9AGAR|nr:acetyl-CoA synthetase-like protein [Fistulina hepatica ATCC 64428]
MSAGLSSTSSLSHEAFKQPPLDLPIPQIYNWHLEHNATYPVFLQLVPAAHRAGRYVARVADVELNSPSKPVVAMLAMSNTITVFTTILGMECARIPVFLLSPRNSAEAIAHLLMKMKVGHLLVSAEPHMQQLARRALENIKTVGNPDGHVHICAMPQYEDLYTDQPYEALPEYRDDPSAPHIIVHSSGSTSFPKPVVWTNVMERQFGSGGHNSSFKYEGEILGSHGLMLFHAIGVLHIASVARGGHILAVFPPVTPPVVVTPESTFHGLVQSEATCVLAMPSIIEEWAKDPAKVEHLRHLKAVYYGGGVLQKKAGDSLARAGVRLYTTYGLSEVAGLSRHLPAYQGAEYEYWDVNPMAAVAMRPLGDGTFEPIVLDSESYHVAVKNVVYDDREGYATSDIVVPHPSKPGFWKLVGRLDDQIVLSTGEKTNPGPLESILRGHPLVKHAVMFGRGRFQNGVLVAVTDDYVFDPNDQQKLRAFRDEIWPQVERMNEFAPSHSRLTKEMIIVAGPRRPFPLTAKGSPRRAIILNDYADDIEQLYASLASSSDVDIAPPEEWTRCSSLVFLRAVVHRVMGVAVEDNEDLFYHGCDSLQATYIRRTLLAALKSSPSWSASSDLSSNVVYDHPSISALAKHVCAAIAAEDTQSTTEEDLKRLVEKYTTNWPTRVVSRGQVAVDDTQGDVVLLTGSTGSLGTSLLAHLLTSESVQRVYAFNRPKPGASLVDRQREAFKLRGYDPNLATSPKVVFVEGRITSQGLEITENNVTLAETIRTAITHIIHIAWRVDWKLSLRSFEDAVAGVRGLVDLALSSPRQIPPRLLFTSSVAVVKNFPSSVTVPEAPITDPRIPLGQGYGEGKWVAEQILDAAQRETELRSITIRLGQLSGGVNGAWNKSDWVPAMIKSSVTLGYMPTLSGVASWLDVDIAAKALCEARDSPHSVLHLLHPRPVKWHVIAEACASQLGLQTCAYSEWLNRLESAADFEIDAERRAAVPALMLLDFFTRCGGEAAEDREALGMPRLLIDKMLTMSVSLRNASPLGSEDVRKWLSFWKRTGFLANK